MKVYKLLSTKILEQHVCFFIVKKGDSSFDFCFFIVKKREIHLLIHLPAHFFTHKHNKQN